MENHEVLMGSAFFVKKIKTFSSATSKIRKKLDINLLFRLIKCFKTFLIKKNIFFVSFDLMFRDYSISHTYTQNFSHFNSPFLPLILLLLIYTYPYSPLYHPMPNTHIPKTISFTFNLSMTST